jgi:hypothetical protein
MISGDAAGGFGYDFQLNLVEFAGTAKEDLHNPHQGASS